MYSLADLLTDYEVWDIDENGILVDEEPPNEIPVLTPTENEIKASRLCDWLVMFFLHLQLVFHALD